ncbi:MAG: hypothetical protein MUC96_12615 [Myxococcaceae bacterium]|jgi:hypothetical protein|nr:hypothetical protein [Myxococcaceae bacterium]
MRRLVLWVLVLAGVAMADHLDTPRPIDAASARGTYSGVKLSGEGLLDSEHLVLTLDGTARASLTWSKFHDGADRGSASLGLEDVRILKGSFSAKVIGRRPPGLPARLTGDFITRSPPANAKGRVRPGLRLEGDWFLELESP